MGNIKNRKKTIFFVLAVLWTGFIFYNSAQSGDRSSEESGFFVNMVKSFFDMIGINTQDDSLTYIIRKTAHFTEYFIQSALISAFAVCICKRYKYDAIYVLFAVLLTACCDECIQLFSGGRTSSVLDVFIDFGGGVCAAIIFGAAGFFYKKHFTKLNV